MTDHDEEAQSGTIVSPAGVNKVTADAMVVMGVYVRHRSRALAAGEVEIILDGMGHFPLKTDVKDALTELDNLGLIRECPDELHGVEDDGATVEIQVRYRLVVARIV